MMTARFHGKVIFVLESPGNWPEVARIVTIKRNNNESALSFLKRCQRNGETFKHQRFASTKQSLTATMEVDYADDQPTLAKIILAPTTN